MNMTFQVFKRYPVYNTGQDSDDFLIAIVFTCIKETQFSWRGPTIISSSYLNKKVLNVHQIYLVTQSSRVFEWM